MAEPELSVAVVGICSAAHVERCLDALARQEGAPPFEVIVAHDPHITGLAEVAQRHPRARFVSNAGQRNPLELAARALMTSRGALILLTEDHCVPRPDWVQAMVAAQGPACAAVGGVVDVADGATATDWAFYFVDFFRYAPPAKAGPSPSLTVCNVAYRREHLAAIQELWAVNFHETAINDALRERFGPLRLEPRAVVTMGRHVSLSDALYERYAFGRLFGCTRLEFVPQKRLFYVLTAPALPFLLLGRMKQKSLDSGRLFKAFLGALVPLLLMVLWWSWGEWLGYLTRRHPRSLVVAPEIRAAQRAAQAP